MTTNFLYTQAPNRKGNISKHVPGMSGPLGATAVVGGSGGLNQPSGNQGAPKTGGSVTAGRGQKVMVQTHCDYDGKAKNTGYMNADRTNYLK